MEEKMSLSKITRKILDQARSMPTLNTSLNIFSPKESTTTVWYSAIDGTVYSFGSGNPNKKSNGETKCLIVKSDGKGPLPEIVNTINPLDSEREELGSNYAAERVLEQIREYRETL
jgi:hypothetical protein